MHGRIFDGRRRPQCLPKPFGSSHTQSLSCYRPSAMRASGRFLRARFRLAGIVRAGAKIGLQNLAYNIRRLVTLERLAAA